VDDDTLVRSFGLAAMRLTFREGIDIGEPGAVLEAGRRAGIDERTLSDALQDQQVKDATRALTEQAVAAGVFGVPTVLVGERLFWGDDRLGDAASAYGQAEGTRQEP
jgi:2-hydroxychromene-2-carboxylate isomerase